MGEVVFRKGGVGTLNNVRFRHGGGSALGMIELDSARVSLQSCTFTASGEDGIRVRNAANPSLVTIAQCTFTDNAGDGIECSDASPTVRGCSFAGNENALRLNGNSYPAFNGDLTGIRTAIWLDGATLTRSGTWSFAGLPYVLGSTVTVARGVTLTVAAGVVVKGDGYWQRLIVEGDGDHQRAGGGRTSAAAPCRPSGRRSRKGRPSAATGWWAQGTLIGSGAVPPDRFVVGPYSQLYNAE